MALIIDGTTTLHSKMTVLQMSQRPSRIVMAAIFNTIENGTVCSRQQTTQVLWQRTLNTRTA